MKKRMNPDTSNMTPPERLEALERWALEMDQKWAAAFPNGDGVSHCNYHLLMIEDIRAKKELIKEIKQKSILALLFSVVAAIGTACWFYFKSLLGK